jgi:hypothetical protein
MFIGIGDADPSKSGVDAAMALWEVCFSKHRD